MCIKNLMPNSILEKSEDQMLAKVTMIYIIKIEEFIVGYGTLSSSSLAR